MQTMEYSQTEKRIDDLDRKVDCLRAEMRDEFKNARAETLALREAMETRFDSVGARFDSVGARFDSVQRSMLWMMGTMLVVVAGILASANL